MTFTITVDDALADQLRKQAATRQLSAEDLAVRLLSEAVEQLEDTERWGQYHQRRVALIHQSATTHLSAEEAAELDALQAALDRRLASMDDRLLAGLERLQHAVDDVPRAVQP
jgi:hypothetical protein